MVPFIKSACKKIIKSVVPPDLQHWIRAERRNLPHRVEPFRRSFGLGYGQCIDRYYTELFLSQHAKDISGHVLELQDNSYTRRFGGNRVDRSDVLDIRPDYPGATLIADLSKPTGIPSNTFDCIILTMTLPCIYDVRAAISEVHRILKPGGIVLSTFPGIAQICRYGMERWGDYWRFTTLSAQKLFSEIFASESVETEAYGNVLAAVGLLHGLVVGEVSPQQLDHRDRDYELVITVRAMKRYSDTE
jgi:SAM-dependent methyltransferase